MNALTYNGWTNYETWLVNIWLTGDGPGVEKLERDRAADGVDALADVLAELADELAIPEDGPSRNRFAENLIRAALNRVNWDELVTALTGD